MTKSFYDFQSSDDPIRLFVSDGQTRLILEAIEDMKLNEWRLAAKAPEVGVARFHKSRGDALNMLEDKLCAQVRQYEYERELAEEELSKQVAKQPLRYTFGDDIITATVVNVNRESCFVEFEHEGHFDLKAYMNAEEMKFLSVGDKVYVEAIDYNDPWYIVAVLSPQDIEKLHLPRLVNAPAGRRWW